MADFLDSSWNWSSPLFSDYEKNERFSTDDSGIIVELDLPGVKRDAVRVLVNGTNLAVEWTDRHGAFQRRHYRVGNLTEDPSAEFRDGLLTIRIPKKSVGAEWRQIAIA